jgi:hypothetical protein
MIKLIILLVAVSCSCTVSGQERVLYNFEGFAFNGKGKPLADASLKMRIWLRNSKAGGSIVYDEVQPVNTDEHGLFMVRIGNGKPVVAGMAIPTSERESRYLKVEMSSISERPDGPVRFKCVKCRRCMDKHVPMAVFGNGAENSNK